MILERSDHPLPAGDALLMTHLETITDRLRDLKFVIWIDYKCARQLLSFMPSRIGVTSPTSASR